MSGTLPPSEHLALGPVRMVLHGIYDYMLAHDGETPNCIELHPAAFRDFWHDFHENYEIHEHVDSINAVFHLVPVIANQEADEPRLITRLGNVEPL